MTDGLEHPVLDRPYDALQDAVYVFDETRTLIDANARVGEVSGRSRDALLGWTVDDFADGYVAEADRERVVAAFDRIHGGESDAERLTFDLYVGDEQVPVDGRLTPYGDLTVVVLRSLAEQREREQRLTELSEELEVLNRVLRHDIRNDMSVVLGWADELEPHVDPEGEPYFENIVDAVEHTVELTQEVRDLAEALIRNEDLPTQPMSLDHVLADQLTKNRKKFEDASFAVEGELPAVSVVGNEMLSSVFDNLLSNAVIHHDRDHPVVTVSAEARDDEAVVRVADDGPGIPDSRKEVVFGRNEQGLDSPGSGIGLFLVDRLVTGFGGSVTVEDNEPRGTVFVLTLPLADEDGSADAPE